MSTNHERRDQTNTIEEPGRMLSRDISKGEGAEADLDAFISKRHHNRVRDEDERAVEELWRASERRVEARRAEENWVGLAVFYRHLENVYTSRAAECGRAAEGYERKAS